MKFLLKSVFWVVVLLLLLPTDKDKQNQIYGTVQSAMNDVGAFCTRNPQTCASGQDAFSVLVQKAKYGSDLVMGLVEGRSAPVSNSLAQDSLSPQNPPQSDAYAPAIELPQTATLQGEVNVALPTEPSAVMPVPAALPLDPAPWDDTPPPRHAQLARPRSGLGRTRRLISPERGRSWHNSFNPFDAGPSRLPQLTSIFRPWTR